MQPALGAKRRRDDEEAREADGGEGYGTMESGERDSYKMMAARAMALRWHYGERIYVYCFTAKNTLQRLQGMFEADDKDKIEKAVTDAMDWTESFEATQSTRKGFEAKQKELEDVVNPIMMKVLLRFRYRGW